MLEVANVPELGRLLRKQVVARERVAAWKKNTNTTQQPATAIDPSIHATNQPTRPTNQPTKQTNKQTRTPDHARQVISPSVRRAVVVVVVVVRRSAPTRPKVCRTRRQTNQALTPAPLDVCAIDRHPHPHHSRTPKHAYTAHIHSAPLSGWNITWNPMRFCSSDMPATTTTTTTTTTPPPRHRVMIDIAVRQAGTNQQPTTLLQTGCVFWGRKRHAPPPTHTHTHHTHTRPAAAPSISSLEYFHHRH